MALTNTLNIANINVNMAIQANPVESVFPCRTVHAASFVESRV